AWAGQAFERLGARRDGLLFPPTRRPPAPPPVVEAAPPPPPPPPNIVLLAVVMDGEDARAVVRAGTDAKIMRVQIGDDVDGWKVGQIEARKLVLSLDDRTAIFTMFTGNNASSDINTGAAPKSSAAQPQNAARQTLIAQPKTSSNAAALPNTENTRTKRPHRQR